MSGTSEAFEAPCLQDYQQMIKKKWCKWCEKEPNSPPTVAGLELAQDPPASILGQQPIQMYSHDDGWPLRDRNGHQWLFVTCPTCKNDMSLNKLGIPRNQRINKKDRLVSLMSQLEEGQLKKFHRIYGTEFNTKKNDIDHAIRLCETTIKSNNEKG